MSVEQVLGELAGSGGRYLIVGGVAVVLHGHPRFTADLDLIVDFAPENLGLVLRALESLEYRPRAPVPLFDFADEAKRSSWIRDKGLTVFSLWSPRFPLTEVDLFVEQPLDFRAAFSRAEAIDLGFGQVTVASIDDLITLKSRAGRPKDLEDIRVLETLKRGSNQ